MILHSCEGCGVVLDLEKLHKPEIEDEDGVVDTEECMWDGEEFLPKRVCPVCSGEFYAN